MGISFRNPTLYIGFPSVYISSYSTYAKLEFSFGCVYFCILAVHEMCFRDRGIDWLCMKHVSEIGVFFGCV